MGRWNSEPSILQVIAVIPSVGLLIVSITLGLPVIRSQLCGAVGRLKTLL